LPRFLKLCGQSFVFSPSLVANYERHGAVMKMHTEPDLKRDHLNWLKATMGQAIEEAFTEIERDPASTTKVKGHWSHKYSQPL
jgi:hypothetical protein